MTIGQWVLVLVGLVGCVKLIVDVIFKIGRWTQTIESGVEQKPKVTLDRLAWELEKISQEIRELKLVVDGRYTELASKMTSDHQLIRELTNWKAGLYAELSEHFYTIAMVDRIVQEGERDRAAIWAEIKGRRAGETL